MAKTSSNTFLQSAIPLAISSTLFSIFDLKLGATSSESILLYAATSANPNSVGYSLLLLVITLT